MEEHCFQSYSLAHAQLDPYVAEDHLHREWYHPRWAELLTLINNKDTPPLQAWATGQSDLSNASAETPSLVALGCVQWAVKMN